MAVAAYDSLMTSSNEPQQGPDHGPDYDGEMDRRTTILEAKWDAVVPTLATKADLAELRSEMHQEFGSVRSDLQRYVGELRAEIQRGINETQRWMLATVIGLFLGFSGLFFAGGNGLKPQAAQQQPIVINVPAAPQGR
jgi:hypothetical protein